MDERKSFGKGDLFTKLEEVSRSLENEANGYLIGGLAMMYHGAKETTKDVDIVIDNDREY